MYIHGPTHTTFHCLSLFKWSRKETTSCPRITHYVLTAVLVVKIFFSFKLICPSLRRENLSRSTSLKMITLIYLLLILLHQLERVLCVMNFHFRVWQSHALYHLFCRSLVQVKSWGVSESMACIQGQYGSNSVSNITFDIFFNLVFNLQSKHFWSKLFQSVSNVDISNLDISNLDNF